jgi:hypothetical protein
MFFVVGMVRVWLCVSRVAGSSVAHIGLISRMEISGWDWVVVGVRTTAVLPQFRGTVLVRLIGIHHRSSAWWPGSLSGPFPRELFDRLRALAVDAEVHVVVCVVL